MRARKQGAVINELEPQAIRAVDQVRDDAWKKIQSLWEEAKRDLKLLIMHEYHRDFAKDKWSLGVARAKGTLLRIERHVAHIVNRFHEESLNVAQTSFRRVYKTAVLRHAWILDQVTPPSYDVRIPANRMMAEAAVAVYTGTEAETQWKDRWSTWLGAYQSALNNNIRMGALNESTSEEAAGEVDDTKAGTPAYDVDDALDRVYNYQALSAYSDALRDLSGANGDMGIVEIWQTRYNARVCDDCDANRGLTIEEADGDIPLHPNCECYWRLVPKSWAALLQSGDMDERELALLLDARNEVPSSMILKDDDGELVGHTIVNFERWSDGLRKLIGTGGTNG